MTTDINKTTLDQFIAAAIELGLKLNVKQVEQISLYQSLLLDWNQRVNLTAVREPGAIQDRHFLDSLTCVQATGDLNGRRLIDVGSGAGFPGLPLSIAFPQAEVTLLESTAKKCAFLREVVQRLALKKVTIVNERAEIAGRMPEHREQYDWALARAVANLRVLVEYLLPFCRLGGKALAMTGPLEQEGTRAATRAVQLLGGENIQILPAYPAEEKDRRQKLVLISKQEPTPDHYPRRNGIPQKRPL